MKWDHETNSDIMMTVASKDNETVMVKGPAGSKQTAAALSTTQNALKKSEDPYANEPELIEGEVSHMAVEAQESRGLSTPPLCSSPCSSTSSHDEPLTPTAPTSSLFSTALGGGVKKLSDPQAASSSSTSISSGHSRSSIDQNNRSSSWSFSSTSSSSSSYSTHSSVPTSSLIRSDESVYAAVPISHELYIIPKSSRGFHWNGDLFLKPHQRRSLGVDHMFNMADQQQYHQLQNESGNGFDGSGHGNEMQQTQRRHNQDSSVVVVHEIHLDDQETAGILPTWP
ncbi:hypothetical protein BGX27_008556 [Mortierella sp. AM989]|nr:hypothetical protein BGX27_008556 [Mortierella sp. AM989]